MSEEHPDPAALFAEYREQVATYREVAAFMKERLEALTKGLRLDCTVKARHKAPAHLVLKALEKVAENPEKYAEDPVGAMGDRAGARVIAAHLEDVATLVERIGEVLWVVDIERKRPVHPHELGYLGVHLQVRLREEDVGGERGHLVDCECEVQIHTIAQSAWATVSHPLLYKPVGGPPPREVSEKVYRAVSLVSLFDDEVAAARERVKGDPLYRPVMMYDVLTKAAIEWRTPEGPDDELSLAVLALLSDVYSEAELERFPQLIDEFLEHKRAALDAILAEYRSQADEYELLFQPEVIAIYERLTAKKELLRSVWIESGLPLELLETTANALGNGY